MLSQNALILAHLAICPLFRSVVATRYVAVLKDQGCLEAEGRKAPTSPVPGALRCA